jgi:uncharacterized protein (DUF2384 family)
MGAIEKYIADFEVEAGLRGTDLANLTGVSKATISRWRNGTAFPHPESERLISDLHYLIDRLTDYYPASEIRTWLYAPHPQLEGRRAIEVLHDGGLTEILKTLERMDEAAYL